MRESLQHRVEKIRLWAKDPDRAASHILVALLSVTLIVAIALLIVWVVPHLEVARAMKAHPNASLDLDKQLSLENEFRKTLTQIVLSIFGLFILYFTWQRARAGDKTVEIMEQGHITDRYTKAIEQLGKIDGDKPNIEVRLGAIYALERIARDSPRDHWTIMEVLTAYVRQNAPVARPGETPKQTPQEIPRTDIQAILTVLGRRLVGQKREQPHHQLDLSISFLHRVNLLAANLQGAFFRESDLEHAFLFDANLQDANLGHANLHSAFLDGANLQRANLVGANMQEASFNKAKMQKAQLAGDMEKANFSNADLKGIDLAGANLKGAFFLSTCLEGADLSGADLREASLEGANLGNASLTGAKLKGATFGETAEIESDGVKEPAETTSLKGADLRAATGLTPDQIRSAKDWESAHFSPDLREALGLPAEVDSSAENPGPNR